MGGWQVLAAAIAELLPDPSLRSLRSSSLSLFAAVEQWSCIGDPDADVRSEVCTVDGPKSGPSLFLVSMPTDGVRAHAFQSQPGQIVAFGRLPWLMILDHANQSTFLMLGVL